MILARELLVSHKKKAKDFSILVQFIVDSFNTGDYVNPLYRDAEQELHRRFQGHFFGSDFIKEMFRLRQNTGIVDPYFVQEVENIAEKIVEKEILAIKAVSDLEREMLLVEGELIKMEAEVRLQKAFNEAMEKMDRDLAEVRRKFNANLAQLDFSGLNQAMDDFRVESARTETSMHQAFRRAVELPPAERFQACRRHLDNVRTIIKSFVYEP